MELLTALNHEQHAFTLVLQPAESDSLQAPGLALNALLPTPAPLPTLNPTATPPPGWWDEVDFATPALPSMPDVPDMSLTGETPGQAVPFDVLSCATTGVQITGIETVAGPWWHIYGVASIPNQWY